MSAQAKAEALLARGRLTLIRVGDESSLATCAGEHGIYHLGWNRADGWWCDCPARVRKCSHVRALALVILHAPLEVLLDGPTNDTEGG